MSGDGTSDVRNPSDSSIPLDKPKSCPVCNRDISHLKATAKYCSDACKQRAYIERRGIVTRKPPQVEVCQNRRCENKIESRRSDSRYCSPNCQKMEWHWKREEQIKMYIKLLEKK